MVFTTLSDYITTYKDLNAKESKLSYTQWMFDNELIEDDEVLNKNLDYIHVLDMNILDKHAYYLKKYIYTVKLTDEEYRKYRCNAHRLAFDIFGNPSMWFLILNINEMYSEADFNKKVFKMYRPEVMDHINEICLVENRLLLKNKADAARFNNALKIFFSSLDEDEKDEIEYDVV